MSFTSTITPNKQTMSFINRTCKKHQLTPPTGKKLQWLLIELRNTNYRYDRKRDNQIRIATLINSVKHFSKAQKNTPKNTHRSLPKSSLLTRKLIDQSRELISNIKKRTLRIQKTSPHFLKSALKQSLTQRIEELPGEYGLAIKRFSSELDKGPAITEGTEAQNLIDFKKEIELKHDRDILESPLLNKLIQALKITETMEDAKTIADFYEKNRKSISLVTPENADDEEVRNLFKGRETESLTRSTFKTPANAPRHIRDSPVLLDEIAEYKKASSRDWGCFF